MSKPANGYRSKPRGAAAKPSPGAIHAQKAIQLLHDDKPEEGIELLEKAIKAEPGNPEWRVLLGRELIKQHKPDRGIQSLRHALALDPNRIPALIELGQACMAKNGYDEARPLLDKALKLAPDSAQANLVYGSFLHKQGQLPKAVKHFRKSLKHILEQPAKSIAPKKKEDFDKPATEELMWSTLSQLARAGVHAFAAYGTLLGLTRQGGLLPFDKDIDFGLPHTEMEAACRCLRANGWLEGSGGFLSNPRAFVHPLKKVSLDLSGFVVDPTTGDTYTGFWIDGMDYDWARNTRYPAIHLRKGRSPNNEPLWQLQEPETWLEAVYGDWRTPDPDFDTVIAAKNLCDFSPMTQCYAFGRIYSKWEQGNLPKALALVRHSRRHLPEDALLKDIEARLSTAIARNDKKTSRAGSTDSHPPTANTQPDGPTVMDPGFGAEFAGDHKLRFDH